MPHKLRPPSSLPMTADGRWKTRSPSLAERQDQPQQRTTTTETSAFGQVTESHSSFARVPPENTSVSASSSMTSRPSFSAPKQRPPPSRIGSAQQLTSVEPHNAPACVPASVNDDSSRRWSLGIDVASLSSTAAPVVVDQNRNPQLQTAHYIDTEATSRRSFSDLCDIVAVVADVTPLDMNHPGGTRQRPHHRDRQWVRTPTTATTTGSHTAAGAKALNHPQPVQEAAASASLTTDRYGHPTPMTSGNRRASSPVSDPLTRLMRRVAERERMAPPPLTEPTVVPDGSSSFSPSTRQVAVMSSPCPASSDIQKQFPSTDHLRSPWGGMSNYNDHHAISQHASTDITTTTPLRASSALTAKEGTLAASNEAQTALAIALSVLREGSTHRTPRHAFYQPTPSSSSSSHQLPLPPPSSFVSSHVVASPSFAVAGASPIVYASPLTPPRQHHHQGQGGVSQKRSLYQDIDLAADAVPHHYNGIPHENRYDPDSLPQYRSTWTSPRLAS